MTVEMDWAAPIEVGQSMLGLSLGLQQYIVTDILSRHLENEGRPIAFRNSPDLLFEWSDEGNILLRDASRTGDTYQWQNILGRLIFKDYVLSSIVVDAQLGSEGNQYKGALFGKIRLGSKIADLLEFCALNYDDVEEVFRLDDGLHGLEIGGTTACDLSVDPNQVVTFIRIY